MAVFITGTGTDVGKTIISAWLCLHTNAAYWKPIQSGEPADTDVIESLTKVNIIKESFRFKLAQSPHAAAKNEGVFIDFHKMEKPVIDSMIIEGSGGVLVPINQDYTMIDLIKKFQIPIIVVATSSLGTINHTCLTLEALRVRDIPTLGVIMNGPANLSNKEAIEHYGKTQVLAEFPVMQTLNTQNLLDYPLPENLLRVLRVNL